MKKSVSITVVVFMFMTVSIALFAQAQGTEKLSAGTYTVYARAPQVWRFNVDAKTMKNATVTGKFTVNDGTPKNIDVFVFDQANYMKFVSEDDTTKAGAKPIFSALKKSDGTLGVKLTDSGNYYLVLSNLYQYEGKKILATDISLTYEK